MARQELTEEQLLVISEIAKKLIAIDPDEGWTAERVERSVISKMWDGVSFQRSVMMTLIEGAAPDPEKKKETPLLDDLRKRVEEARQKARDRFALLGGHK